MIAFLSDHMQSVVALAALYSTEEAEWTSSLTQNAGTGFLYAFPSSGKLESYTEDYNLWLVTCKHVVEGILNANGYNEMIVRANHVDQQNMVLLRIDLQEQSISSKWHFHPSKDVAVIRASWSDFDDKGIQWRMFAAGRNAITKRDAINLGISEGYAVFFFGFPVGWREGRQDYPIVRQGILAQTRGWLNGDHEVGPNG